jgi:hypothetical protein
MVFREAQVRYWVTATALLMLAGAAFANATEPQQQVLAQFSVGTGTTLVGFKIMQRAGRGVVDTADTPGRVCLKLPFNCAFVIEPADADGSGVVVRPQIGPIAFEVAVNRQAPSGS